MSLLKLIGFVGESPKIIPRLLSDQAAQIASNVRLDDGGLTPVRLKRFEYQFPSYPPVGYKTIYRDGTEWLGWEGEVYAAPGPVATDRLYIMGDGVPKMKVGGTTYPLKVPFPATPLTATLGGAATPGAVGTTRLYVYTWVTAFGEESEPNPVSADVFWTPGQTLTLSGFTTAAPGRNITLQRIYRAQTGKTGTQLYFIAERADTAANFVDTVSPESIQEVIPSVGWNAPPDTLTGLISLPNGMMAAFTGKDLYFCEPYRPHAWPEAYQLTMDYDIVGLGAFGSSMVVTTTGLPYMVTGTAPENMISERIEKNLPCINARGIMDLGYSVVYPSPDGLVLVNNNEATVITVAMFSRDDWLRLNPVIMVGGQYNGRYFSSYNFIDQNGVEQNGTLILDLTGEQKFLIRTNLRADAMFYDVVSGELYMLIDGSVYQWDALSEAPALLTWKSKPFIMPKPTNFGAILVEADGALTDEEVAAIEAEIAAVLARNAVTFLQDSIGGEVNGGEVNLYPVNGDMMEPVPSLNRSVNVNVYADGALKATVGDINRMARLPGGFLAQKWEIEVVSDMHITQIMIAGMAQELANA